MIEDLKGMKETIAYGSSQFRLMKNQETEDYPPHWHTSIEIIMPLENGYQAVIGNECYTLNPLDLLFINSGEIHSLQAPATGKRLIFQAPLSLFYSIPGMGSALLLLPEAVCLTPASCPELFQEVSAKFKEIIREAEKSNYLADALVSSAVIQIVLLLVRHNFEHTPRFTDVSFSSRREYMEKFTTVCQYIDTSFRENLTLEQAAEIAGFSKYHFSRLFKEFTGITFQEYLTRQRIRHAEELLTDSKISITDIALASGFSSVSNFNRSFQMYNHCSPSQFRKKLMHV